MTISQGFTFNLTFYVFHISEEYFFLLFVISNKKRMTLNRKKKSEMISALNEIKFKSTLNWAMKSLSWRPDYFVRKGIYLLSIIATRFQPKTSKKNKTSRKKALLTTDFRFSRSFLSASEISCNWMGFKIDFMFTRRVNEVEKAFKEEKKVIKLDKFYRFSPSSRVEFDEKQNKNCGNVFNFIKIHFNIFSASFAVSIRFELVFFSL